ncbi:MAG: clostripain-related cysteine peptidase [Candidatus Rifleibacteriota bacterium]
MKKALMLLLCSLLLTCSLNAQPLKEWTILVYAVTDSVLSETVKADIDEMETAGSDENIEILMQLDQNDYNPVRYKIVKDDKPGFIASNIVGYPQNSDCGSWETLDEFVAWGLKRAPAKRVMLILHGCLGNLGYGEPVKDAQLNGNYNIKWAGSKFKLDKSKLDLELSKENGARYMGIRQMGFALESISKRLGKKIDLVCLDDSCECSIEKLYEYNKYVDYWVGSAGFLPSDNWPYDLFLADLNQNPQISSQKLAKKAVKAFKQHYTPYCDLPYGFGATLTAFKLSETNQLMSALKILSKDLYSLARKRENRIKILNLREKVLHYLSSDEIDLKQFAEGLIRLKLSEDQEFIENCKLIAHLSEKAKLAHWADGRYYKDANGVSLKVCQYLFGYDLKKYKLLKWDNYSRWAKFLVRLGKD